MADECDRNLWDVLGLPSKADALSVQGKEQSQCTNEAQEQDLDKAPSDNAQWISHAPHQVTAGRILVSIAETPSYNDSLDVPVVNGGDASEPRHLQQKSVMKVSTNQRRDSAEEKAELSNGSMSTTFKHSPTVANGSVEQFIDTARNVPESVECNVASAVNTNNSNQQETSAGRQERSIFEHINSINFRSAVTPSQNHVSKNVAVESECHRTSSETAVPSNNVSLPLDETIRNVEPTGDVAEKSNLFERVRINSLIDSLAQQKMTREGNGEFPFSDKLRQLTAINKEVGIKLPTVVRPLRTGYETVASNRSFRQVVPASAPPSAANTITARIVNGQLKPIGAQAVTPSKVSQVNANVIFPSVTPPPLSYQSEIQTSLTGNNREMVAGYYTVNGTAVNRNNPVRNANSMYTQPNAVAKIKHMAADKPSEEHAHTNLAATHLIGPFISAGPPPPNTYVAAVRTAQLQTLNKEFQSSASPQMQEVRSTLKGHSSSSGFKLVLPVYAQVGIRPPPVANRILTPPITLNSVEGNILSHDKKQNLICGEKLLPSPDFQERSFRPVSPPSGRRDTSPRVHQIGAYNGRSEALNSPLRVRRSVYDTKTDLRSRGSVEEELADQSYECALRESAHSPDIERYLRCESPLTVLSSPNTKSSNNSYDGSFPETFENHVNLSLLCNGASESVTPSASLKECTDYCSTANTPESTDLKISDEETEVSKRKLNSAMIRRLEPRLPSPVRERGAAGDLYRDPSELTREERALQRAMMQFSEMEMKEKAKEIKKKDSLKRRLRKRPKDKSKAVTNVTKTQTATKVWLKKFKRKRLWFSQRKSMTIKPQGQEDDSPVKSGENQEAKPVKRKRSNSKPENQVEQPKNRRKSDDADKRALVSKPTDVHRTKTFLPNYKNTDTNPAKVRRSSSDTRGLKTNRKENLPETTSVKRSLHTEDQDMKTKVAKCLKEGLEPLKVKKQEVAQPSNTGVAKPDRSHRVKTYMLVTAYQGFRDFKPVVLESRTRGKGKQTDEDAPQKTSRASEFPLLVVESVHSKPVKNSIIAENKEVQHLVENCLKARGKWQIDETLEESVNEDENLKEARKLNVNRNTGETVLHKAARLGYHETVQHHIHQGIDPNAKDNAGWTPLHEACSRGHVDVVKVLAKYGADVNACSNDGIRPIHDAAEGGHVAVLRVLLSYGADPLLATYSGSTAVSCAKEPNTRAFLEGVLEDLDLRTPSAPAYEGEGCWDFGGSSSLFDDVPDHTNGIFEGVSPIKSSMKGEFEMCDRPHLPTYNLPVMAGQEVTSGRRNYVLLSDLLEHLRISRVALLKKVKRLDIHEMPWSHFMAEIAGKPLCVVPKCCPSDSSTQEGIAELVPINYNLRRLLNIRTETVSMT